jgi:hypothetical protein
MSFPGKKPMATVLADPDYAINSALTDLSGIGGVLSVKTRWIGNVLNIWIGLCDGDAARDAVYEFENSFLERFAASAVEFHVLTIPNGRRMEDYVSDARTLYQRAV